MLGFTCEVVDSRSVHDGSSIPGYLLWPPHHARLLFHNGLPPVGESCDDHCLRYAP